MHSDQNLFSQPSSQTNNLSARKSFIQLFQAAGQGVLYQAGDGEILSANPVAERLLGLSEAEMCGKQLSDPVWSMVKEDGTPLGADELPGTVALRTEQTVSNFIMGIRQPVSKRLCWVNATAVPEYLSGQECPSQVFTILVDISGQKQDERKLNERIKELQAFYSMTEVDLDEQPLETLYQRLIDLLPKSWQYPDITCGRIVVDGKEYGTQNYSASPWVQAAAIKVDGKTAGMLEIVYLEERPQEDEGPFLKEERLLIDSIANRVGRITERRRAIQVLNQENNFIELAMQATKLGKWQQNFAQKLFMLDETACAHFGLDRTEVPADELLKLIHPDDLQGLLEQSRVAEENANPGPINTEYRVIHPDGSVKWLAVNTKLEFAQNGSGRVPVLAVGTTQDITERKQKEEALNRKTRSLYVLSACNQALVRISDEIELLQEVCKICVEAGEYRCAWVGTVEHDPGKSVRPFVQFGFEDGYLESAQITWADTERGRGPTGTAVRLKQPVISQNLEHDPNMRPWRDAAIQRGYRSSIALPMIIAGEVIGVFTLYSRSPYAFMSDEVDLLGELTNDLSYGIEALRTRAKQVQLEEDLRRSERRYRLAQQAAHMGSWEWNLQTGTLFWSDEMYFLFEKDPLEYAPTIASAMECIHPEDKLFAEKALGNHLASSDPFDVEYRIVTPAGQVKWLHTKANIIKNESGQPVLAVGTMQDVTQRRQMEDALNRANQNYRLISENTDDVIWALDVEGKRFTYVSPSVKKLRGYTPEEVLQQTLNEVISPNSIQVVTEIMSQYLSDFLAGKEVASTPVEIDQIRKDGSLVATEITSSLVFDALGRLQLIGISRDITERKRAEEALRISNDTTQAIFNATLESMVLIDTRGSVLSVNKTGADRFNSQPKDLIGKNIFSLFPPELAESRKEKMDALIASMAPVSFEDNRDGRHYLLNCYPIFDPTDKVSKIVIYARDITEAHLSEEALRQTEETQRALLEAITESVLLIKPDGTGILANSITLERLRITEEQFKDRNIYAMQPPEIAENRKRQVELAVQTRQAVRFEDIRYGRHILNIVNPVLDDEGAVSRLAIFSFDITELKKAEEEISRLSRVVVQMGDTVIITDVQGCIEYVNPAFEKLTGYSAAETVGKTPRILKSGLQTQEFYESFWRTILSGNVFEGEVKNRKKNGELFVEIKTITPVMNAQGKVINFIATGKDITDRKRVEEQLLASEHRNKAIVDAIPDLLFRVKTDGTFLDYIAKTNENLYAPPEAFIGKKISDVLPADVAELSLAMIQKAYEQKSVQTFEYRLRLGDNWQTFEARVVANASDEESVLIVRDVTEQRKMEAEIRKSEEKYRLLSEELEQRVNERTAEVQDLYDNAPTGYHSLDIQGVFRMINETELKWLGYTREEVVGKLRLVDLMAPEDTRNFERNYPIFKEQGHIENVEYTLRRKDGSFLPIVMNATAIYDKNGEYILSRSTLVDNTERKKNQDALRQSEALYRALFENSNDGIYLQSPEGVELRANRRGLDMLGYTPEEYQVLSEVTKNAMAPEEQNQDDSDRFEAVLRGEAVPLYERTFIKKNAGRLEVEINLSAVRDESGNVILVQSVVRDITERKAIEAEIRRVNTLSDAAFELAQAGYWFAPFDDSGCCISSDRVIEIHGDDSHADHRYHIRNDWFMNIRMANEDLAAKAYQALEDVFAGRSERYDAEYAYRRPKDGKVIWVHSIGNVVRDGSGKAAGISGVDQDITQQKIMEHELNNAKEAAEAANKAKSVFLANMSHEIRTPMNAILGFTQILLKDQDLVEKNRNYLEIINRSGEHLLTLINEILEMSKIEAGHVTYNPVTFNLSLLIHDIRSMFIPKMEAKDLSMALDLAPDMPEYIISDENKVKEILINLLGNAVKFTQKGGVTLRTRVERNPKREDPKALIIFLDIEDTGIGIEKDEIPRLFKAFEQTRSGAQSIGGTGLGLTISQSHARLMGGEITITSTPGVGSCFHVRLEAQVSEPIREAADLPHRHVTGLKPGTREIKVLIVDDHEENRLVLKEMLDPVGITTRFAENGQVAVDIARSWLPEVILMDLRMPHMNGFDASKEIKSDQHSKDIHVVAVTASILDVDQRRVVESGMTGYVRKPFKDYELFSMLQEKLGNIFIYQDQTPVEKEPVQLENRSLTPEAIAILPQDMVQRMRSATMNAQMDDLLTLIEIVAAQSPVIASSLRNLANGFQYDTLLKLFDAGENHGD
jgi:PAS domain S-box-containing protein